MINYTLMKGTSAMSAKKKKSIPPFLVVLLILITAGLLFVALIKLIQPKNQPLSFEIPKLPSFSKDSGTETAESGETTESAAAEATPAPTETPTPEPTPEPVDPANVTAIYSAEAPTQYFTDNDYRIFVDRADGSSELVQHDETINNSPIRAFDDDVITSWQEGAEGYGEGENITAYFAEKTSVTCIKLCIGNWKSDSAYERNGRPKTLTIELAGQSYDIEFPDEMIEHYVVFSEPMPDVDHVKFTIGETYNSYFRDCCISEIEFYHGEIE